MATKEVVGGGMTREAAAAVQKASEAREILFVTRDTPFAEVLKCDGEGARVVFEHELEVFKRLEDDELAQLSHETRVGYSVSAALNAKDDPENNEFQQRIKVMAMRDQRSKFEREVHTTAQSSVATKKLQAFVGNGFSPHWARVDKIEQRLAQGYSFADARDENVYAGVTASKSATSEERGGNGHYEIRSRTGEPELVLMKVPNDVKADIMRAKDEAAKRLSDSLTSVGRREIVQQGGRPVDGRDDLPWVDRK